MKPQSAKSKGRIFQQWVRDKLYKVFPKLTEGDIESRSMGAGGEDIMLSPAARKCIPYSIECKSLKSITVYKYYEQAKANSGKYEPLVFVKANHKKPLAVIDAEYFIKMLRRIK